MPFLFKSVSRLLCGRGLGKRLGGGNVLVKTYQYMARTLLPNEIVYRGHKICIESPDAMGLSVLGRYNEEYELSLFESEIDQGSIVLDLGANIGLYALTAARHADKVYCFEPDPVNFFNLQRNIEANQYRNVVTVNKAVSDKSGFGELSSTQEYPLSRGQLHLLDEGEVANQRHIPVQTIALNEFFYDKPTRIDIVKMDVEGFEFEALRGMKSLIESNNKMKLFIEFNPYTLSRHGTNVSSFIDYLYTICNCFYHIDEIGRRNRIVTKEWLIEFSKVIQDGHYANLMGLRNISHMDKENSAFS